jgi:hypothetical protein
VLKLVTELDKLVRAQQYIAKLAEGVDPITDAELPQDTVLNHVRLSRCFFYVAGVLSELIENGGKPARAGAPLPAFHITDEELRTVKIPETPVNITTLLKAAGDAAPGRKKPAATAVTGWLVQQGYLKNFSDADGKNRREVTENGKGIGLFTEMREGPAGRYLAVLYPPEAQRFILSHLNDIAMSDGKA